MPIPVQLLKIRGKRIKDEVLDHIFEWLHASGRLQNLSFGHKHVRRDNGAWKAIEAVKTTASTKTIIKEYILEYHADSYDHGGDEVERDEEENLDEDEEMLEEIGTGGAIDAGVGGGDARIGAEEVVAGVEQ
jgi:hypothetical protein